MNILSNVFLNGDTTGNAGAGFLGYLPMIIIVGLIVIFFVYQYFAEYSFPWNLKLTLSATSLGLAIFSDAEFEKNFSAAEKIGILEF